MKTLKFIFLTLLVLIADRSIAQLDCQYLTPPNFNVTLERASTFTIISGRNIHVKAILSFSNFKGNNVELLINDLQINSGTHIYNFNTLANSIKFNDQDFEQYYRVISEFIPGNYQVCLNFYCINPPNCIGSISTMEEQSNFCFELESLLPTPLLLAKPDDMEKLHTNLPLFQWIPPMPISSKIQIQYKMKIVELKLEQGAEDGMVRNRPIFESEMLSSTNHQYMSIYSGLEKGKRYSWMVDAYVLGRFLTNSEVWEFSIYDKPVPKLSAPEVKTMPNSTYSPAIDNSISFCFNEKNQSAADQVLEYELLNFKGEVIASHKNAPLEPKVPGMNFYSVDICDKWHLESGKYLIKLSNVNLLPAYFQFDHQNNCN